MAKELRAVTLGTTYFNNPDDIKKFIAKHIDYCDELIVVDDGSTFYPAHKTISAHPKLKLYRVKEDLGFNSHGCRNLIMKEAANDWVCLLDSDRELHDPEYAFNVFKTKKLKTNCRYRFMTHGNGENFNLGVQLHGSVNDYLIHRSHFFSVGGYDEEIVGIRTGDRQFFEQLLCFGTEEILVDIDLIILRGATNYLNNPILNPSTPNMKSIYADILKRRSRIPEPNKPIIQFEWERVL